MGLELTQKDIDKIKEELHHRIYDLRPHYQAEVQRTREFGDLSENYEYRAAKQERNRNDSRIRYLEGVLANAKIISQDGNADEIGLFDKITVYFPEDDLEEVYRIVTTMRIDAANNIVSRESPFGRALLGHRVGDTVTVRVDDDYSYEVTVRKIEKEDDNGDIPITSH